MDKGAMLKAAIDRHRHKRGPLLLILHEVQAHFGYIPPDAVIEIAKALNLSRADVHGVMSFYHEFRTKPRAKHILRLCRAEACQAVGARNLWDQAKAQLGLDWRETSRDHHITLEPVFCLGLCANGPAAELDGLPIAAIDEKKLDDILRKAQS